LAAVGGELWILLLVWQLVPPSLFLATLLTGPHIGAQLKDMIQGKGIGINIILSKFLLF
jgi:hypothetical protein